uniref:DDE-1 domain-containing protein n=1 Tax=Trichuris muris TaxID=70415 RepID=A0A5S6Q2U4_TRIMR
MAGELCKAVQPEESESHREAASADVESASSFPAEFEAMVDEKGYLAEQVFNCDETALFWKKMPTRTYIHRNARQAAGFKPFKDRFTLVLCGNAAGHMIKPGLIYRACTPRSLKNKDKKSLPVFWQYNRKAWMTAVLFLEWFHQCFVPEVKSYLRLKGLPFRVLLIIDNAPGHPQSTCFANENVEVMFLPPNSTPLLQPLDQGIAKCVKAAYVRLTFARIRDAIDANPQMSVMESWKNFTIADAIALIAEAVQTVKPETLNACWRPLWRNVVNDFKGFPSIEEEVANIRSIAMAINAEGFFDIAETDLRKHLDHSQQVLSNEELEELTRSSTDSDGDELDGSEDTQPPTWTLKKFADIFQQAQILKDKILEYDPSMERGLVVTRE